MPGLAAMNCVSVTTSRCVGSPCTDMCVVISQEDGEAEDPGDEHEPVPPQGEPDESSWSR